MRNAEANKVVWWIGVIAFVILTIVVGVVFLVPSEAMHLKNHESVRQRLSSEIPIPVEDMEFVAGRFRRESIIIYRVSNGTIPTGKFSKPSSSLARGELEERISEVASACGMTIPTSADTELLSLRRSDYSVICVNSTNVSYIIYFGAQ